MPDVVVTVPKALWNDWILEGDAAGLPESGEEWGFYAGGQKPRISPGERVYVVAHGLLRGYAALTTLQFTPAGGRGGGQVVFGRKGGAQAVTIDRPIRGFQGWRYRFWDQSAELPFPLWKTKGVDS